MQAAHAAGWECATVVGDEHVDDQLVVTRAVQACEPLALAGREVRDALGFERIVPAVAPLGCDALRNGVRDLVLVVRVPY